MPTQSPRPADLLATLPANTRQRAYWPALLIFAADYIGYILCVSAAVIVPTWGLKAVSVVLTALVIAVLYVIAHDAGHGSYVPGRRWNRWLARFAFFPAYTPLAAWFRAHVLLHHNFLRVRGRDMVWMPWTLEEYGTASVWRRGWYRFFRTPLGLTFYWTVGNWVPYLLFPPGREMGPRRRQNVFDRALVVGFAVVLFAGLWALCWVAADWPWAEPVGPIGVFFLGLVLPYIGFTYLVALTDLVHHAHPDAMCFASRDDWDYYAANVRSTTHVVLPFGLNRLMHNILEHSAHHVDPRIPLYHLPRAQEALEAAFPASVPVAPLTPGHILRILRTCRLYDYDRRQWLDYNGAPTSAAQRPDGPSKATPTPP